MIHTFRPCVVPTPSTQLKPSPLKPVDHEFALDERGEHVAPHRRFIQLLKNAHPQEVLRQGVFRTKFRSQGHQPGNSYIVLIFWTFCPMKPNEKKKKQDPIADRVFAY